MSDVPEKKLNLKALSQKTGETMPEEELTTRANSPEVPEKSSQSAAVESLGDQKNDNEIKKEETPVKSTKMSFASIRKSVEETPNEDKKEDEKKDDDTSVEVKVSVIDSSSGDDSTPLAQNTTGDTPGTDKPEETQTEDDKKEELTTGEILVQKEKAAKEVKGKQKGEKKEKKGWLFNRKKKEVENILKIEKKDEKQQKENKEDQTVKFANYESHFKKESTNFLSKFQKFRYAPKTRISLIFAMIGVTVCIIGGLMFFIPQKHSPEIYKASIMQLLKKDVIVDNSHTPLVTPTVITKPSTTKAPPKEIKKDTNTTISKQEESKEKLRQHLLNKYSG